MDVMSISTGNPKVDHVVGLVGTVVTLSSIIAGSLNSRIRAALDSEGEVPSLFLYAGIVLNYLAINLDKAAQLSKILRGAEVTVLSVRPKPSEEKKP